MVLVKIQTKQIDCYLKFHIVTFTCLGCPGYIGSSFMCLRCLGYMGPSLMCVSCLGYNTGPSLACLSCLGYTGPSFTCLRCLGYAGPSSKCLRCLGYMVPSFKAMNLNCLRTRPRNRTLVACAGSEEANHYINGNTSF